MPFPPPHPLLCRPTSTNAHTHTHRPLSLTDITECSFNVHVGFIAALITPLSFIILAPRCAAAEATAPGNIIPRLLTAVMWPWSELTNTELEQEVGSTRPTCFYLSSLHDHIHHSISVLCGSTYRLSTMGVDHGGTGETSPPPRIWSGGLSPRFCHVAKF